MNQSEALDLDTSELGGRLSVQVTDAHIDAWVRNLLVILVEQNLGMARYAGWVSLSREALADPCMRTYAMQRAVDALRPWRRPDPTPIPSLDLFPRVTAVRLWLLKIQNEGRMARAQP